VADGQYRSRAIDFMRENSSRVPIVSVARLGRTFNFYRPFQQVFFERERNTDLWVLRLAVICYWALLPPAVAGVVIARRRGIPVYPLLVFPVTVLIATLFTIGAVRYRAPAEIPLVLLAAVGLDAAIERSRRRTAARPVAESPEVLEVAARGRSPLALVLRARAG
jgi:hypothetical protein